MKYIKYLLLIVSVIVITGCNYNSSPEAVAKEMAKRLSNENYKDIVELLYTEKDVFIDEKVFKEYLDNQNINMVGNKNIEVLKDSTDNKNIDSKLVKIKIDNDYVLNVNTIKFNGKWYVDIGNQFISNYKITVPTGATVKLNDQEVSKKYIEETNEEEKIQCSSKCERNSSLNIPLNADVYVIPQILNGTYKLTVEDENGNYEEEAKLSKLPSYVYLKPTTEYQNKIKKYIENSIQDIFTSIENDDKENIKKYYHEKIIDTAVSEYNKIEGIKTYTTFIIHYKDIKLNSLNIKSIYSFGNSIIVNGTYTYSYVEETTYIKYLTGTNSSKANRTYDFTMHLEATNDNSFKFMQGDIIFGKGIY